MRPRLHHDAAGFQRGRLDVEAANINGDTVRGGDGKLAQLCLSLVACLDDAMIHTETDPVAPDVDDLGDRARRLTLGQETDCRPVASLTNPGCDRREAGCIAAGKYDAHAAVGTDLEALLTRDVILRQIAETRTDDELDFLGDQPARVFAYLDADARLGFVVGGHLCRVGRQFQAILPGTGHLRADLCRAQHCQSAAQQQHLEQV